MLNLMENLRRLWYFIVSPNYSRTLTIIVLLIIVAAVPLTVFVSQQRQEIRQRAEECTGPPTCRTCEGNHRGDPGCNCRPTCRLCTGDHAGDSGCPEALGEGRTEICDGPETCPTEVCDGPPTCPQPPTATPEPRTATPQPPTPPAATTSPPPRQQDTCTSATQFCTAASSCSLNQSTTDGVGQCAQSNWRCCTNIVIVSPTTTPTPITPPMGRICLQCVNNVFQAATGCDTRINCEHITVGNGTLCMATPDVRGTTCGPGAPPTTPEPTAPPTTGPRLPPLAADCDRNNCVGIADFNCWATRYQTGVTRAGTNPDCNQDNSVNLLDFNCWYNAMLSLPENQLCR